jgi:uncharacterized protein (DUF1800 family)
MALLDPYSQPITAKQAAHFLRRTTFGPTQAHIAAFTGVNAALATQTIIDNIANNPTPLPIDLDSTKATAGQTYIGINYDSTLNRNFDYRYYYKLWWLGMMATQNNFPSILDKMTLFWQNHFVTTEEAVDENRAIYQYFMLIRNNILGNFKDLVFNITKDPAMLKYLNGNENTKTKANENYARELQELFVVGAKDFAGNSNYTEDDVKAAARALTGWSYDKFYTNGTSAVLNKFTLSNHDTTNKQFSTKYPDTANPLLGTVITGRNATNTPVIYPNAGEAELDDLLNMLFRHPETPKFICRKLYRFFVNPNVTQNIEDNVIVPMANIFKSVDPSTGKTFEIKPVLMKLLTSEHFYDEANIGSIVKSPAEFVIGTLKFFNFPVPTIDPQNLTNTIKAFRTYTESVINSKMNDMQMAILDQPTVFGYDAYFQTGYSKNWINTTQIGLRNAFTDIFILDNKTITITPSGVTPAYKTKIDMLAMVDKPTTATPYYNVTDVVAVVDLVTKNFFAIDLNANQKNFLIDTIMMASTPRTNWGTQWNTYKTTPNTANTNAVKSKLENLMKYILRMAEYQIC